MHRWRKCILLVVCALLLPIGSKAQTPYFLKYSTDDGLSSNIIYDVMQDKDSYLWISTDKGVCRYDGYGFKIFNLKDGLADNEVIRIEQDAEGRIWFLTLIGKLSYFYQDSFYNKSNCSYLAQVPDVKGYLHYFAEDEKSIFFGSSNSEVFQIGKDSSYKRIPDSKSACFAIWNYDNQVYTINNEAIYALNNKRQRSKKIRNLPHSVYSTKSRVFSFDSKLFFCAANHICGYDQKMDSLLIDFVFPYADMDITSFFFDSKQKLWVGTRRGIFLAQNLEEAKQGKWQSFLENSLITCIYEDSEKNIWIGSMGKALYYIPHSDISWIHQPIQEAQNEITTSLYVDKTKKLWSSHDNNTFIIHSPKQQIKYSLGKLSNLERISLIKELNGADWVIGKSKIRVIKNQDTLDIPYFGNDMILDKQGNYWLASNYIYLIPKSRIDSVLYKPSLVKDGKSSSDSVVLSKRGNVLFEDKDGGIWIGLFEGLYYYRNQRFINYSDLYSKLRGKINAITSLPDDDKILIATDNFGLVVIDIKSGKPVNDPVFNSLGKISCSSITLNKNHCWLGTNKGIIYIDLNKRKKAIHYSDLLGLKNLHVLDIAIIDDKLYAASSNGLLEFDHISPNTIFKKEPPIFLSAVYQKERDIHGLEKPVLSYWENELNFKFKGISFKERGSLTYKYQLIGLDKNFQYTQNQDLVLKALPPGKYELVIYAINKAGIESLNPAVFNFQILKPYWQQWWFILLISLIVVAVFVLAWRIRLSIIRREYDIKNARLDEEKKRIKLEHELSEVEQHALRLQMNPHFIFNALNSIKGYYAEKKIAEADEYLSRFSKILRHILENSRRYSSLEEELDILHLYLEMAQMRHPGMFDYSIEVQKGLNASDYSLPSLLLQPFVENSIMHGIAPKTSKGKILVECHLEEDYLICTIQDNGIGYSNSQKKKKESEHQSKAIEISKKRLEYITRQEGVLCSVDIQDDIKGDLVIGTLVRISIPAKKLW